MAESLLLLFDKKKQVRHCNLGSLSNCKPAAQTTVSVKHLTKLEHLPREGTPVTRFGCRTAMHGILKNNLFNIKT